MNIFRTATSEAIREMIQAHAETGRFGYVLTEESLAQAIEQIVDLFETTIMLRTRMNACLAEKFTEPSELQTTEKTSVTALHKRASSPLARKSALESQNASSSSSLRTSSSPSSSPLLGLPRRKVAFTEMEKAHFEKI